MRMRSAGLIGLLTLTSCAPENPAREEAAAASAPPYYIAGGIEPGRAPDGATTIFAGPDGLVVVDTGRHPDHQAEILAYAEENDAPIAAIVNTHWHLDHTGGNAELRAAFPDLKIYATRAVEGALEGFLARGRARNETRLEDPDLSPDQIEDVRLDIEAVDNPGDLRPDIAVEGELSLPVNGRSLTLYVTDHAVTEADIWIWDPATRTAVVGDLVTLPAPFFDTACAEGWRAALAEISAMPLALVVPGHGPVMTPEEFALYRQAFENLVACAADAGRDDCAARWVADAGPLISESEHAAADFYADAYVERILRNPEAVAAFCPASGD